MATEIVQTESEADWWIKVHFQKPGTSEITDYKVAYLSGDDPNYEWIKDNLVPETSAIYGWDLALVPRG